MNLNDEPHLPCRHGFSEPATSRPLTVLCVDDDPNVSEAIARRLGRHGIRVLRGFLGIQGLSQAVTTKPDVIILDLVMPKGSGMEILECLQNNPQTAHIPVFILTGNHDPAMERCARRLGAACYFYKPVPFDELLEQIGRHAGVLAPTGADPGNNSPPESPT